MNKDVQMSLYCTSSRRCMVRPISPQQIIYSANNNTNMKSGFFSMQSLYECVDKETYRGYIRVKGLLGNGLVQHTILLQMHAFLSILIGNNKTAG